MRWKLQSFQKRKKAFVWAQFCPEKVARHTIESHAVNFCAAIGAVESNMYHSPAFGLAASDLMELDPGWRRQPSQFYLQVLW